MSLKKSDWFLIIFLGVLITLTILFLLFPEWGTYFNLATWADPMVADYTLSSGLLIALIACFLGALVPFPVPYTVIIGIIAYQFNLKGFHWYSILLMILVASISNITGDSLDWILGRGGTYFAEKSEEKEKMAKSGTENTQTKSSEAPKAEQNRWEKLIYKKPGLIPFLLVLFGLTPLPDSLIFVPLGVLKYSIKKALFFNWIGKFLMMAFCALAGIFVLEWFIGVMGGSGGQYGWVSGMVILFLSWALMAIMLKKK